MFFAKDGQGPKASSPDVIFEGDEEKGNRKRLYFGLMTLATLAVTCLAYFVISSFVLNEHKKALGIWVETMAGHIVIDMKNDNPYLAELAFSEGVKGMPVGGKAVIFLGEPEHPGEIQEAFLTTTTAEWVSLNLKQEDPRQEIIQNILKRYKEPGRFAKPITASLIDGKNLERESTAALAKASIVGKANYYTFPGNRILISHYFNRQEGKCVQCHMHSNAVIVAGEDVSSWIYRIRAIMFGMVWPVLTGLAVGILQFNEFRRSALRKIRNLAKIPQENPSPILRILRNGRIVFGNKASEVIQGTWGVGIGDIVPPEWRKHVELALAQQKTKVVEFKCEDMTFEAVLEPIQNEDYIHLYAKNISPLKTLFAELDKAKKSLEQEHKEAEEIGKALLLREPAGEDAKTRLACSGKIVSSSVASGDRAGWLHEKGDGHNGGKDWFVVFDASGHGLGAAKFQDIAIAELRLLLFGGASIVQALRTVNESVSKLETSRFLVGNVWRLIPEKEMSAEDGYLCFEELNIAQHFVMVLDRGNGALEEWRWGDDSGKVLPLGLFDDGFDSLRSAVRKVKKGSRLITYTDGITEAANPSGERFGLDRLKQAVADSRALSVADTHKFIIRRVRCWRGGFGPDASDYDILKIDFDDDIALVIADT